MKAAVIGGGSWGTALASVLASNGHDTTVWAHDPDVARALAFYTQHLGFKPGHQQLPAFANITLGHLTILLSGPGASGSRPRWGGAPSPA